MLIAASLLVASCERPHGQGKRPQEKVEKKDPYWVKVVDSEGRPLPNATVYLSYSSTRPPEYITDSDGVAWIPEKRARNGGWVSIIAVYDPKKKDLIGSLAESHPEWPVTIQVSPR